MYRQSKSVCRDGRIMKCNLLSLQILEAVYRHRSVARAADELAITASAVSHQIRTLSEDVGEKLIEKSGRGIVLTDAGTRLAEALSSAFSEIDRSVMSSIGGSRAVMRLAFCSSFGPGWMIPRMQELMKSFPDIDIQLRLYAQDPRLTDAVADAFLTAYPLENGYISTPLFDEMLIAVHRPGAELGLLPLITAYVEEKTFARDWQTHASKHALAPPQLKQNQFLQCTHYSKPPVKAAGQAA